MPNHRRISTLFASSLWILILFAGQWEAFASDSRTVLSMMELTGEQEWDGEPVGDIASFVAPPDAEPALHSFQGTLKLSTVAMETSPSRLRARFPFQVFEVVEPVLDKDADAKLFPGLPVEFFTHGGDLVPVNRGVIRAPLDRRPSSFWDLAVQPGRVWSEQSDEGWSRAAFPFALVSSLDGDTRNGIATFLFKDDRVSTLRFQIVTQTAPFMQNDKFTAWGEISALYQPHEIEGIEALRAEYEEELGCALELRSWKEMAQLYPHAFSAQEIEEAGGELTRALVVDEAIYYRPIKTEYGTYPFTDRARYGVWSVSKSLTCGIAMLRLAQKYGPEIFDERLLDYFRPEENNSGHDGWDRVTFGDV